MAEKIRVLIADDHPVYRRGLVTIIESEKDIEVIGEAENGEIALEIAEKEKPDVIILDIDMPVLDGVETAQALKNTSSKIKRIFLTMHKDKFILKSLKPLNVKGYVVKDSAMSEIVRCIRRVAAGEKYLSPALSELIFEDFDDENSVSTKFPAITTLTQAEKQVLRLIAESKTSQELAKELFVSIRTIETHRYNICAKLDLKGTHALFKFAIKNREKILSLTSK